MMLEKMYPLFGQEPRLVQEIKLILDVMQSDGHDTDTQIYTDIFAELSTTTQCEMLLTVADQIQDHLDQCRLLLLAMKRFSTLVSEQGMKLVEKLLWSERQAALKTPVNSYRKLLVCDVIPLVLTKCQSQLTSKQLYKWLQKCMEFYVCYTTTPYSSDGLDDSTGMPRDLFSPTKKTKRHASISGLSDSQSLVTSPWTSLYKILVSIGSVLKWEMDVEYFNQSVDYQWQQIQNLYNRDKQTDSVIHQKQILFTTALIYLQSVYNYVLAVNPSVFSYSASNPRIVLIDSITSESSTDHDYEPAAKKPREDGPTVTAHCEVSNSTIIIQHFTTAVKCHALLMSTELLNKDFSKLRQLWQMHKWKWTETFDTDMSMHMGSYLAAVESLQTQLNTLSSFKPPIKLQLASCLFKLHQYQKCCELLLDIINTLESMRDKKSLVSLSYESPLSDVRNVILSTFNCAEILPYCVHLLIALFQEKWKTDRNNDTLLGHMVVLLQSDWPRHESMFNQCISHLTQKGAWSYSPFFDYIINIDMLEEFAFIQSNQGGSIKLDVVSDEHRKTLQPRVSTLDSTDSLDEFTQLMESQVTRCKEPINILVLQFIANNHVSILQSFV